MSSCHPAAPCPYVTWVPLGSTSQGLHVTGCHSMSPCHCGSTTPGSMSPCVTQQLHVTMSPCLHITWAPHHKGSVSPGLHVTLCHLAAPCHCGSAMPGSMSPGLYVIVSLGSSVSLCHPGSTGLHITWQLHITVSLWFCNAWLHITRAPCHLHSMSSCHLAALCPCVTRVPFSSMSPSSSMSLCHLGSTLQGLHVTLCHLAAPYHHVTWVPQYLAPCHQGSMTWDTGSASPGLCDMGYGLHVTRAPCHPVSPGSSMSPHHCGSTTPVSMSPGLRVSVPPGLHITTPLTLRLHPPHCHHLPHLHPHRHPRARG